MELGGTITPEESTSTSQGGVQETQLESPTHERVESPEYPLTSDYPTCEVV